MTALLVLKEDVSDKPVRWPSRFVSCSHGQLVHNARRCAGHTLTTRGLQVIVSLLISSIMLGKQGASLGAIIRTTNRKQELKMLVGELARARGSNISQELLARARRATEHGERGIELVRLPVPSFARFLLATAERVCPAALLASLHSALFRP